MPSVAFTRSNHTVSVELDGQQLTVPEGITVAAAIALSGASHIRTTPLSGEERSPFCHMGVCFECLVEIDGVPNQQGCCIIVAEGMRINRQQGSPVVSKEEARHA